MTSSVISSLAVGGQAVHHRHVVLRPGHQFPVDLEGGEGPFPVAGFPLLAHARPHVGVDGVGAAHGLGRIVRDRHVRARGRRRVENLPVGLETLGTGQREPERQLLRSQQPGVRHVVAVAHERHLEPFDPPLALLQGEQVRQHLAGVVEVGQRVDHRHGAEARPSPSGCPGRRSVPRGCPPGGSTPGRSRPASRARPVAPRRAPGTA